MMEATAICVQARVSGEEDLPYYRCEKGHLERMVGLDLTAGSLAGNKRRRRYCLRCLLELLDANCSEVEKVESS